MRRKLILPPLSFFLVIVCAFLLSGVLKAVRAEELQIPNPLDALRENISDEDPNLWQWMYGKEQNQEIEETGVIPAIEYAIAGQLGGIPDEDGNLRGGMINAASGVIASIYSAPPASGIYYARNVLQKLGIAPAYAASGVGFSGLQPVLPIWKAFRNTAYALFTIAFLTMGLMIMFRIKISPQAVLTVENALPKMIGTLVLITFSYAIAGFMIDLMYVIIALLVNVLKASGVQALVGIPSTSHAVKASYFDLIPGLTMGHKAFSLLGVSIGYMIGSLGLTGVPLVGWIGTITGSAGGLVGGILFCIVWLIIVIVLLFKLIIALIKTYINIIIAIIFSPLLLLVGVIPGKNSFGEWLKNLTAHLLVFPAVLVVLMIGSFISSSITMDAQMWYPPLMGPPQSAAGSKISALFIKSIISVGFILILPSIPDIVKNAFGIKDSGIGAMIGQSLAPVKTVGGLGITGGKQFIGKRFLDTAAEGGMRGFLRDYAVNQRWYTPKGQESGASGTRPGS